jgi:hypothetical protein
MSATFSTTITADGDHFLAKINDAPEGFIGVKQSGTGTWTLKYSPDGGVTFIDMKDSNGDAFTGTSSDITGYRLARGVSDNDRGIYMNVTGASGLTLDVDLVV